MRITLRKILSALIFLPTIIQSQNFHYGSCYYPEQVSHEQVRQDAILMKEAGFNVARMGDFAWYEMESEPGIYTFDWLKNAVNTLAEQGIESILCTPTAPIPKWMYDKHPDIMQVTADGRKKPYGKRRHACLNNEVYRRYSKDVAAAMAKAFVGNEHIAGIQIDNELGAEEPYCYCPVCQKKFAQWLKAKYKTIETLNQAWGTTFWSQKLNHFEEVWLPRKGDNPSAFQDFQIFTSDYIIDFFKLQKDAIKELLPQVKITHNICSSGFLYQIDLYQFAKASDFLSIDNYPYTWTLENEYGNRDAQTFSPFMADLALSQIRGSGKKTFWVTEAQIGRTAGLQRNILQPGIVRLWAHQEYANGANGITYFMWRPFAAAHEHTMNGVIDIDNIPRKRYFEAQKAGKEIHSLFNQIGVIRPMAKAAIIRDFHCDWAFEDGRISGDYRYMRTLFSYYRALREQGITTDIVSSNDSFDGYSLLVVPAQIVVTPDFGKRLKQAAERGSTIIITCMSGLRNANVTSLGTIMQTDLTELCGFEVEEQHSLFAQRKTLMKMNGMTYSCGLWHDLLSLKGAQPLAYFESQYFKGKPAVTRNIYGKGTVFYIATVLEQKAVNSIVEKAIQTAEILPAAKTNCSNVALTEIRSEKTKKEYLYALNFTDKEQTVTLNQPAKKIFENKMIDKEIKIPAMEFYLLELSK